MYIHNFIHTYIHYIHSYTYIHIYILTFILNITFMLFYFRNSYMFCHLHSPRCSCLCSLVYCRLYSPHCCCFSSPCVVVFSLVIATASLLLALPPLLASLGLCSPLSSITIATTTLDNFSTGTHTHTHTCMRHTYTCIRHTYTHITHTIYTINAINTIQYNMYILMQYNTCICIYIEHTETRHIHTHMQHNAYIHTSNTMHTYAHV